MKNLIIFVLFALVSLAFGASCNFDQNDYNSCTNNCKINAGDQYCDNLKCDAYCYNKQNCIENFKQQCLLAQAAQPTCNVDCNSSVASSPWLLLAVGGVVVALWAARR